MINKFKTKNLEILLTFINLLFFAGALTIFPPQEISLNPIAGLLWYNIVVASSYLILAILITINWRKVFYVSLIDPIFILLLVFVSCSIFWSASPDATISNVRGFLRSSFFGIYLATRYSLREQMWLFAWVFATVAILSISLVLFTTGYGVHISPEFPGRWCGIYGHKNDLGLMMCWGTMIFLHLALSNTRYRWLLWGSAGVSVCLIILSGSTTSLAIVISIIGLLPIYKLISNKNLSLQIIIVILGVFLLLCLLILLLNNADSILGLAGKNTTLSGRDKLWENVLSGIQSKLLFGYGLNGFWASNYAYDIRLVFQWAGNAHNGFLQILLDIGIVGFVIFIIGFMKCFLRAVKIVIFQANSITDFWIIQMFLIIIVINMSEARLLDSYALNWVIYVAVSHSLIIYEKRPKIIFAPNYIN